MRDILFRGKQIDNGEWVYGGYVYYEHFPHYQIFVNKDIGGDGYNEPKYMLEQIEIIPETIGQYTGLTDKNGAKIFEGDILKDTTTGYIYQIKHERLGFIRVDKNKNYNWTFDEEDYVVIGNIHDNPELINKE